MPSISLGFAPEWEGWLCFR